MIYVVEVPYADPPFAWRVASRAAFFGAVDAICPEQNGYIYARSTPRELLTTFTGLVLPHVTTAQIAKTHAPWVLDLAERYGWWTPLYRADYVRLTGWSPAPVDKFAAYVAALTDGLAFCMTFGSKDGVSEALADARLWSGYGGADARAALSELITSPRPPSLLLGGIRRLIGRR